MISNLPSRRIFKCNNMFIWMAPRGIPVVMTGKQVSGYMELMIDLSIREMAKLQAGLTMSLGDLDQLSRPSSEIVYIYYSPYLSFLYATSTSALSLSCSAFFCVRSINIEAKARTRALRSSLHGRTNTTFAS